MYRIYVLKKNVNEKICNAQPVNICKFGLKKLHRGGDVTGNG
jgi:hypothetical protein